jgi:hypothetical protein
MAKQFSGHIRDVAEIGGRGRARGDGAERVSGRARATGDEAGAVDAAEELAAACRDR